MRVLILLLGIILFSCAPKQVQETKDWRYYYDLGLSAYYAKNYSEAVAHFSRALQVNPKEPKVWNALGLTYTEVKEYGKAEEAFKKALQVDPSFSEAKMNLGVLYLKTGRLKEAEKYLKEAVADEFFEKKHEAYYHLAQVYKAKGDLKSYVENLEKAVNYNPLFIKAQFELGEAYEKAGRYDDAERLYKTLISNEMGGTYALYKLAEVYYEKGDYAKARKIIKRLLFREKLDEEQREKVKELLTKILIAQQRKVINFERELERERRRTKEREEEKKAVQEGRYAIQIAAFSSEERAKKLVETLEKKGLKPLRIQKVNGIYKVFYGSFETKEEALKERKRLKKYNVYGFVVELR